MQAITLNRAVEFILRVYFAERAITGYFVAMSDSLYLQTQYSNKANLLLPALEING